MARERFIPQNNKWISYAKFDRETFSEAVYSQVGVRFPMVIRSDGHVIIDTSDLPSGVTENEVKQAIRDNHPHR